MSSTNIVFGAKTHPEGLQIAQRESESPTAVELHRTPCPDNRDDCQVSHPNIHQYEGAVRSNQASRRRIGHVNVYVFQKSLMNAHGIGQMWDECQAFDENHLGAKLDKIENVLANECFLPEAEDLVAKAHDVLFIDEVWLEPDVRGQNLGLLALESAVGALRLKDNSFIMLQPGSVGMHSYTDAGSRLEKHWRKIGFRPWSYTDEAWLFRSMKRNVLLPHSPTMP